MKTVLITQRVVEDDQRGERRDALDQRWVELALLAGLMPVVAPNSRAWVDRYLTAGSMGGLLLTGGNSLIACGGQAPERDEAEHLLLNSALDRGVPILGVCRGMQVILDHFGAELQPVPGHVAAEQTIDIEGTPTVVNSYHDWGATRAPAALEVWARADDGVIKAIRHRSLPVVGIMWHPERIEPFRAADLALLRQVFTGMVVR